MKYMEGAHPSTDPALEMLECSVCFDDIPVSQLIKVVPTDEVICVPCFAEGLEPKFIAALAHEAAFPVTWGSTPLDPADFVKYLPSGFTTKWVWKMREYGTPVRERVYCRHLVLSDGSSKTALNQTAIEKAVDDSHSMHECNRFLGAIAPPTYARVTYNCLACKGSTCGLCASSFFGDHRKHICVDASDGEQEEERFKGMQRGKDYQLCPKCETPVELRDGCNLILCSCRARFCFICGETVARRETEHFKPGKPCPRWNQPGAKNAHHDHARHQAHVRRRWAEDPPMVQAMNAMSQTVHEVLLMPVWDPPDAHPFPQAILRTARGLVFGLRDHFVLLKENTSVQNLLEIQTKYLQNDQVILQSTAELNAAASMVQHPTGWHVTLKARFETTFRLYEERHEPFLTRLSARIATLQEERRAFDEVPLWATSQTVLGPLLPPAPEIIHSSQAAFNTGIRIIGIPETRRSTDQVALLKLSRALRVNLNLFVDLDLDFTPGKVNEVRTRYARYDAVIDTEATRIAEGVWRNELALKVAVAVYKEHRPSFMQRLQSRGRQTVHEL